MPPLPVTNKTNSPVCISVVPTCAHSDRPHCMYLLEDGFAAFMRGTARARPSPRLLPEPMSAGPTADDRGTGLIGGGPSTNSHPISASVPFQPMSQAVLADATSHAYSPMFATQNDNAGSLMTSSHSQLHAAFGPASSFSGEHSIGLVLPDSNPTATMLSSPAFASASNSAFGHSSAAPASGYSPPSSAFALSPAAHGSASAYFGQPPSATFGTPFSASLGLPSASLTYQAQAAPFASHPGPQSQAYARNPPQQGFPSQFANSAPPRNSSTNVGVVDEEAADALFANVPRKPRSAYDRVDLLPNPLEFSPSAQFSAYDFGASQPPPSLPSPSLPSPSLMLPAVSPPASHKPISTPNSALGSFAPMFAPISRPEPLASARPLSSNIGASAFSNASGAGTSSNSFGSFGTSAAAVAASSSSSIHGSDAKIPSPPPLALPFGFGGSQPFSSQLLSPNSMPMPLSGNLPPTVPPSSSNRTGVTTGFGSAGAKREPDQLPSPSLLMQGALLSPSMSFGTGSRIDDVATSSIFSPPPAFSNNVPSLQFTQDRTLGMGGFGGTNGSGIGLREEQPSIFQSFSQPLPSPFGPSSTSFASGAVTPGQRREGDSFGFPSQPQRQESSRNARSLPFASDLSSFSDAHTHCQPQFNLQQPPQQQHESIRQSFNWTFQQAREHQNVLANSKEQRTLQQPVGGEQDYPSNPCTLGSQARGAVHGNLDVNVTDTFHKSRDGALPTGLSHGEAGAAAIQASSSNSSRSTADGGSASADVTASAEGDSLRCDLCGNKFARKSNLLKHKRSVHAPVRKHVCSICKFAFKRYDHLSKHSKLILLSLATDICPHMYQKILLSDC